MDTETIIGKVTDMERLPHSRNGNGRWLVVIGGQIVRTAPNSSLAPRINNYRNKTVTARVRVLRGKLTLETIEEV